jgi:hypothetical protein
MPADAKMTAEAKLHADVLMLLEIALEKRTCI